MLRCRTCKARFSERKGTPLFGANLPEEKVLAVLEHIAEGCGVRKTGRLLGVHRDTVMRYSRLAGDHAREVHAELVDFSPEHTGGAVRRKVVVRGKKGKTLRSGRPRRRQAGR
jgi:LacI family transcriptional regulator